jgi:hypothetical protein
MMLNWALREQIEDTIVFVGAEHRAFAAAMVGKVGCWGGTCAAALS